MAAVSGKPVGVHAFMDQTSMIFGRDTKVVLESGPKARGGGAAMRKGFDDDLKGK